MNGIASKEELANDVPAVEQLIQELVNEQKKADAAVLDYLTTCVNIGTKLKAVKELVGHGEWMAVLKKLRYDARTANRLMMLPNSAVDQIRISDTNLTLQLPRCLIKLESLCKLTLDQLRDAFADEGWYFQGISRKQIAANVKAICAGKPPIHTTNEDEAEVPSDIAHEPASSTHGGRSRYSSIDRDSHDGDSGCADEAEEESYNADVHEPRVEATFDSSLAAAIGEIAQALYEQVTAAARDRLRNSALHAHIERGQPESDMVDMILRRLANKIAAQLSAI